MISGNRDKYTFEHGMTTRRCGRHDLWKYRQMDIRTWNDYKTMGEYMISVDIRTWNDYKTMWKT
jgi:hypothetical protein